MGKIILNRSKFHRITCYSGGQMTFPIDYEKYVRSLISIYDRNIDPLLPILINSNHTKLAKILLYYERKNLLKSTNRDNLHKIYRNYEIAYHIAKINNNIEAIEMLSDQFYWTIDNEIEITYEQYIEKIIYQTIRLKYKFDSSNFTFRSIISKFLLIKMVYSDKKLRFIGKRYNTLKQSFGFCYLEAYGYVEIYPYDCIVLLKPIHKIRQFIDKNFNKIVKSNKISSLTLL